MVAFSALTGDWHPQHSDAVWAADSAFGERIAHGMLIVSFAVGLVDFDPGYFDDFWTEAGYGGTTDELRAARVQSKHRVIAVLSAAEIMDSAVVEAMDPYQFLAVAGVSRALDTRIRAVDKDVFMRELKYYDIRSGTEK